MNTVYDLSAFLTTAAILYYCNNHYFVAYDGKQKNFKLQKMY